MGGNQRLMQYWSDRPQLQLDRQRCRCERDDVHYRCRCLGRKYEIVHLRVHIAKCFDANFLTRRKTESALSAFDHKAKRDELLMLARIIRQHELLLCLACAHEGWAAMRRRDEV